jgi:hydrogenase expression/formation protein HypC
MCLGIPGRVVEMVDPEHGIAKADVNGVKRNVSVQLLQGEGGVEVGDWVLIHVGFALAVIDEREAEATLRMLGGAPRC